MQLSNVFGSHMVLQRDVPSRVWGWTENGATVTTSFNGAKYRATANNQGLWIQVRYASSVATNLSHR